ncbi:ABC transporter ATP-binding protein [Yoonia sp. 2307UL14-13]|uniref:ABC transporter ATP-binding protein n=1 Tax=Yoonia sp. 2307UL14-13 TaxID=3126506 RepID=UPI0030B5B5CF
MAGLTLRNIAKEYGTTRVIEDINLDIDDGEFVVFVGPSGCGKSTLLRMIAGLEDISGGHLTIGGKEMNDIAPAKRGVAMVFQTYALYPHMSVYKNMAFGLKQAKMPQPEIDERVRAAAQILDITPLLERTPRALSGGQRQRVAIGRAIVREPDVFLFDEPLSNLDAALRVQTRIEIARLHERLGTTMIYVTHDQVEAMTLADKIVVLRGGNIEQVGRPIDLYNRPDNMFVAGFIGSPKMNFFNTSDLTTDGAALLQGQADTLGMRPEHLLPATDGALVIAIPDLIENLGEYALVHCQTASGTGFIAKTTDMDRFQKGVEIGLTADPARMHFFNDETGLRIAR